MPEQKVVHVIRVDQFPEIVRKVSQAQPDHARGMGTETCTAFDICLPQIGHDIELAGIVQLVVRIACDYQIGGACRNMFLQEGGSLAHVGNGGRQAMGPHEGKDKRVNDHECQTKLQESFQEQVRNIRPPQVNVHHESISLLRHHPWHEPCMYHIY